MNAGHKEFQSQTEALSLVLDLSGFEGVWDKEELNNTMVNDTVHTECENEAVVITHSIFAKKIIGGYDLFSLVYLVI